MVPLCAEARACMACVHQGGLAHHPCHSAYASGESAALFPSSRRMRSTAILVE